jgi:hypothetical protein
VVQQKEQCTNLRICCVEIGDGISGTGSVEQFQPILEESEKPGGFYSALPEIGHEEINKLEDMGLCDS